MRAGGHGDEAASVRAGTGGKVKARTPALCPQSGTFHCWRGPVPSSPPRPSTGSLSGSTARPILAQDAIQPWPLYVVVAAVPMVTRLTMSGTSMPVSSMSTLIAMCGSFSLTVKSSIRDWAYSIW